MTSIDSAFIIFFVLCFLFPLVLFLQPKGATSGISGNVPQGPDHRHRPQLAAGTARDGMGWGGMGWDGVVWCGLA